MSRFAPCHNESDPTRAKCPESCASDIKIRTPPQRAYGHLTREHLREPAQTRAGTRWSTLIQPQPQPLTPTGRTPQCDTLAGEQNCPKTVPNYFDGTFLRCALFHLVEAKARGNGSQPWRSCSKCPCRGWNLGPQKADHQREPRGVWGAVLLISGL